MNAMDAIEQGHFPLESGGHQWRVPPNSVTIGKGGSLLKEIPRGHVLVKDDRLRFVRQQVSQSLNGDAFSAAFGPNEAQVLGAMRLQQLTNQGGLVRSLNKTRRVFGHTLALNHINLGRTAT
jgi:hypothetical protein